MSTLSVCIHGAAPTWMRTVSELLRSAADEIVLAVDVRVPESELGQLEDVADRLFRYEYADPPERVIAWLAEQCSGDWILRFDHDEVPSTELLQRLPELISNDELTHYWLLRRWPYPTAATYLDELPWSPNHELRLVRNDRRFVRFPGVLHVPVAADGPGAWIDASIYHFDLLVNDEETRRQKAARWERMRPGMRLLGRSTNEIVYLPELRPDHVLAPMPEDDEAIVRAVVDARSQARRPRGLLYLAGREEIDALWPARPLPESAYNASIELVSPVGPIVAGERKLIEARVRNTGTERWPWGPDAMPQIRLGYHWHNIDGSAQDLTGLRTPLPHNVDAGVSFVMPLTVEAPTEPGDYVFQPELVHEHHRWFGDGPRLPVHVSRPRRLALLARGDAGERLVALALEQPEYEVIVVDAREYLVGARGSRIGMLLRLAARTAPLLWAAGRRRGGPELARALVQSEALVIEGAPRDRVDRAVEAVTKLAARAAGCTVKGR